MSSGWGGSSLFLFLSRFSPIRAATFFLIQDWARQPGLGFLLLNCTGVMRHNVCFCFSRFLGAGYPKTAQFFLFYQVPPPSDLLFLSKSGLSTPAWTWTRFSLFHPGPVFSFFIRTKWDILDLTLFSIFPGVPDISPWCSFPSQVPDCCRSRSSMRNTLMNTVGWLGFTFLQTA